MTSPLTLRILTLLASRRRHNAEINAADAIKKVAALERTSNTLDSYAAELATATGRGMKTGYDLLSWSAFLTATRKAIAENTAAQHRSEANRLTALQQLGQEIEKGKALDRLVEAEADLPKRREPAG